MKTHNIKHWLVGAALTGLAAASAQAAVLECPAGLAGLVSNTSACQYSDNATQDFLKKDSMTVNSEGFFGADDWAYIAKDDDINASSGHWSLNSAQWAQFDEIMLIFKAGNLGLTGYLADNGATTGAWSPASRGVSHITYYGRGTAQVPEPSLMILLLFGLGSVALGRLRSR